MPPVRIVPEDTFRYHLFTILDLAAKVQRGDIELVVKNHSGPTKYIVPNGDLPEGTISQTLHYRLPAPNGWRLVKAHQYLLPDGSIRGGPDPLYIRIDDLIVMRGQDISPHLKSAS